jgi:hypothetical protein
MAGQTIPLSLVVLLTLFAGLVFPASAASAADASKSEIRTFTSADGRQMDAALTRVRGDDVYIERRDGLATKVDIALFSAEDQAFIRQWGRLHALRDGGMEIDFKTHATRPSDPQLDGGILRTTWEEGYELVVKNETAAVLEDVEITYLLFKYQDKLGAHKRNEGEIEREKGTLTIDRIDAFGEGIARTKQLPMLETELAPNYVWEDRGKQESEDEMRGIWVRVFLDGAQVHEISRPESLMRHETW